MSTASNDRDRVTDEIARKLLERAAVLDQGGQQLAQLRDAAIEAGISGSAFDEAIREWKAIPESQRATSPISHRILRNVAAFGAGYTSVAVFAAIERLLSTPGIVHKLTDPVGLAIGALVAMRLRAPTGMIIMGGLAVSQGAEFLMDLLAGAPAIHGFYAHIGLMAAGVGGVLASQLLRSGDGGRAQPPGSQSEDESAIGCRDDAPDSSSRGVGPTNAEADKRFMELLRLRRHSYRTRLQLT